MKIGKTLFAVLLTVFCLTLMVFSAVLTGSTIGTYNPQLDINHDGKIDIKDISGVARSFGTLGDPTVPVNVTNSFLWVNDTNKYGFQTLGVNASTSYSDVGVVTCGGYSRLSIMFGGITNANIGAGNNCTVSLSMLDWESMSGFSLYEPIDSSNVFNETIFNGGSPVYRPFCSFITETKAPYCYLYFTLANTPSFPAGWWVTFEVGVYLRNE